MSVFNVGKSELLNVAKNGFQCRKKSTSLMSRRNRFFNVATNVFLISQQMAFMSQKMGFYCRKKWVFNVAKNQRF